MNFFILFTAKDFLTTSILFSNRTDTATVYSKGAEIIGIYKTILGTEGFKKGLELYFKRFDGKAVTCDDFREAMAGKKFWVYFFSV